MSGERAVSRELARAGRRSRGVGFVSAAGECCRAAETSIASERVGSTRSTLLSVAGRRMTTHEMSKTPLPKLKGTEAQCVWAEKLRASAVDSATKPLAAADYDQSVLAVICERIFDRYHVPIGRDAGLKAHGHLPDPDRVVALEFYYQFYAKASRANRPIWVVLGRALLPLYYGWLVAQASTQDRASWWIDSRDNRHPRMANSVPWASVLEAVRREVALVA